MGKSSDKTYSWKNRDKNLAEIPRFHRLTKMWYRTNDSLHVRRVTALTESILPVAKEAYPNLNVGLALALAVHHEDIEIEPKVGDVPFQYKLLMGENKLSELKQKEIMAAEVLSRNYPKRVKFYGKWYNLRDVYFHAIFKDCLEAQLVSAMADKPDAYGEATHELLAGNIVFLEPRDNYEKKVFNQLPILYPLIRNMFRKKFWNMHPFLVPRLNIPVMTIAELFEMGEITRRPHTLETIAWNTGDPMYEKWKRVTVENFGVEPLIRQTEFTPI